MNYQKLTKDELEYLNNKKQGERERQREGEKEKEGERERKLHHITCENTQKDTQLFRDSIYIICIIFICNICSHTHIENDM